MMEFWTENQEQPLLHNKFWTVPGRHISHKYQDKQNIPDFQHYSHERNFSHDLNRWTVPGSRTGGVLQDYTNWTEPIESLFPAALPSKPQSKEFNDCQIQDGVWLQTDMQRVQKKHVNENRMQMEQMRKRWDSQSPPCYRKGKLSLSDGSYCELEAWAARYCHSLPRKLRLEAEPCTTHGIRGVRERERASQWVSRPGNTDTQGILDPSTQHHHISRWGERVNKPTVPITVLQPPVPEKLWRMDRNENDPSCQQRILNQPPLYIPPPPYNVPHNIYSVHQKSSIKDTINQSGHTWERSQTHNYKYNTLPSPRKQELHWPLSSKSERYEGWKKRSDMYSRQGHADSKTWEYTTAQLQLPPNGITHCHSPRHPEVTSEPTELLSSQPPMSDQVKLKKGMGRGTVFCLVSRPTGVAREPARAEEQQSYSLSGLNPPALNNIRRADEEISRKECIGGIRSFQPADEVDFKGLQQEQQHSSIINRTHLQALPKMDFGSTNHGVPAWLKKKRATAHREELAKAIENRPKKTELQTKNALDREAIRAPYSTGSRSLLLEKTTLETSGPSSSIFPLWKVPSDVTQSRNTPSWHCNKSSMKQQRKALGSDQQNKNNPLSNYSTTKHNQRRIYEKHEDTESSSNGIVVIDATCVVVRAEFILPPKKEHVQYLFTPHDVKHDFHNDLTIKNQADTIFQPELDTSPQNLNIQGNREESGIPETHLKGSTEDNQNFISDVATETYRHYCIKNHKSEETKSAELFTLTVPVSESLEERALRILGLSDLDSDLMETKKNDSPQEVPLSDTEQTTEFSTEILPKELEPESEDNSKEFERVINLADTDYTAENKYLTSLGLATDVELEMISSREQLNNYEQQIQAVPEKDSVFNPTEKCDSTVFETTCNEEPSLSPPESSSYIGEVLLLPPSHPNSPSNSPNLPLTPPRSQSPCLFRGDYSVSYQKGDITPERKEDTTSDICSSIVLQLPSATDSVSPILSQPGSCFVSVSPPESLSNMFAISADHQKGSISPPQCPSPVPFSSDLASQYRSSPLCAVIPDHAHENTDMQVVSLPSQSFEEFYCSRSLWDAVNRIRRHTAPDSENEDECGETWDNHENMSHKKETKAVLEQDTNTFEDCSKEKLKFLSQKLSEIVDNDAYSSLRIEDSTPSGADDSDILGCISPGEETGSVELEKYESDLEEQVEDDTLSCSSFDSQTSKGTVVIGQDNELQTVNNEIRLEAGEYSPCVETNLNQIINDQNTTKDKERSDTREFLRHGEVESNTEDVSHGKILEIRELCIEEGYLGQRIDSGEINTQEVGETHSGQHDCNQSFEITDEGEAGCSLCLDTIVKNK